MIPVLVIAGIAVLGALPVAAAAAAPVPPGVPTSGAPTSGAPTSGAPTSAAAAACLESGDGYLHAHVAGAIEENIDWPNSGTRCQGESKSKPPGVRLSFHREPGGGRDLLFVFGLTGIRAGQPAHATGANLTIIVQGTDRIFGTLGDSRCTVDSLSQRPMKTPGTYRVEARGFCTQPAHAVRGDGEVLVSTFEFAGPVTFEPPPPDTTAGATP
jgi:hypothetical protein